MAYQPKYLKKRNIAQWLFSAAALVFLCAALTGGGMLLKNRLQSQKDQAAFQELAALVEIQPLPEAQPGAAPAPEAAEGAPAQVRSPYQALAEKNPDFAAWLTVPGTCIDYPVMHTPEDIEYYIYRNFYGEDSPSGTPFVGDYGSLEENRCIIYGHNMGDGTMFHDLLNYMEKDFWQENPIFTIADADRAWEYEIFAAVQTRVLTQQESGLRYYRLEDGVEQWLLDRAWYDTGIVPEEGDSIVILSTCSYHTDEGRFLVAGRRRPAV